MTDTLHPNQRFPLAEVVFFGLRTMVVRDTLQKKSAASHLVHDVHYDLLHVQAGGSLANHVGVAVITLKDRAPLMPQDTVAYYQQFKDIQPSRARTTFPLSRSFYMDTIHQHQLVMVKFFGEVLERPLSGPSTESTLNIDMDFVGVVDTVLEDVEATNEGLTKVVRVVCKTLPKVLVDDQVVYYPYQGYAVDKQGKSLIDMVSGNDSEAVTKRGLIINNRILSRLYDPIDVSKVDLQDPDENVAATLAAELQLAEFGLPLRELLKVIFAKFPSLLTSVNYSRDGVTTFPVTLRPRWKNAAATPRDAAPFSATDTDPTEPDPGRSIDESGLRTDAYEGTPLASGLLELQLDDTFAFDADTGRVTEGTIVYGRTRTPTGSAALFGDQLAPCGHMEIKNFVRIYSQLLTGQGSVMGFIEGLVNRPWIELFGETYGRHNNLVFRSPPFDFEDMVETFRQQQQDYGPYYSRVLPSDQPALSLQKGTSDVYTLFSLDIDEVYGVPITFLLCPYVCLTELVDRFGVRPLSLKCQLMPKTALFPDTSSNRDAIRRHYEWVRRNAAAGKLEDDPTDEDQKEFGALTEWFNELIKLRDRVVRWYSVNALFRSGTIGVRCPRQPIRVGTWLTVEHTKDIFYVEDWQKVLRFGTSPTAEISVSRGFNRILYPTILRRTNAYTTLNNPNGVVRNIFGLEGTDALVSAGEEFTLDQWRKMVYPDIVNVLRNSVYNTDLVTRDFFAEDLYKTQ